jgi:hypothetical protein
MRTRMSLGLAVLLAFSARAQDGAASDGRENYWRIVRNARAQDVFTEPVRSSSDLCRTVAAKGVPLEWVSGPFPEGVWHQNYFALSSDDCAALDVNSYKFLADVIEERSLVRLVRNIESIASGMSGETLAEFERYFGRGTDPIERLTYDSLGGVGVSDFDARFLGRSKYELYFSGPGIYFIVLAESDGARFRAVTTSVLMD